MKTIIIRIILIIIIILIAAAIWCYDNTRIIEKPSEEIMKIAREKDGDNISGFPYAYTITKNDKEITLTLFCVDETIELSHTYYITDGIITGTYFERHYSTKLAAKLNNDTIVDKKTKGNIVSGQLEGDTHAIGKDAEVYYNELIEAYSHLERIN